MTELRSKPVEGISRRTFCVSALGAAAMFTAGGSRGAAGQTPGTVKFFRNLAPGHLGVRANQQQALRYAAANDFEGIAPSPGEFVGKSTGEIKAWLAAMADKGIRYGAAGLPVEFRRDEEAFESGLAKLPEQVEVMQQLGVTRVATWILPGSNDLTYLENFKQHERRLRAAAKILDDHGIRLGLEFVGPRTSRARNRFPFICTAKGMLELTNAIGTPNMGLLVDSWHWYTSHGTVEELLGLSNKDIVHVHVNDAPAGVAVDQQVDNRRQLPVTSGVIDMKGFINALVKIGYDGPVECEPFDQELRQMDDEQAVQKTGAALQRVWGLIAA